MLYRMAAIGHRAKCAMKNYKFSAFILNMSKATCSSRNHVIYKFPLHGFQNMPRFSPLRSFHSSPIDYGNVISFNLSDIGEGIREVTVKEWFINIGDTVSQFDKICEVQSDKASVTITSRYDGVVTKLYHEVDGMALVGEPLIDIEVSSEGSDEVTEDRTSNVEEEPQTSSTDPTSYKKSLATPAVRRIAAENQLKLSAVTGSGKNGRVLKEDIVNYLKQSSPTEAQTTVGRGDAPTEDKIQRIQGFKKAMVKTMTDAKAIPHFVYSDDINMFELVKVCAQLKQVSAERGVKLTYMPFFVKAASQALKEFPVINSSVDKNCEYITYKSSHNIGVAMDTPHGLVVPNVKNVQDLSIHQIAVELNRLQKLGQKGTFALSEVTGGTLTLSNIGSIGGTYCAPVILPPEIAIAAMGKLQVVPRYDKNDNIVKSFVMAISWAADHRVVDGATIARFSNLWKKYIEEPNLFLLDL